MEVKTIIENFQPKIQIMIEAETIQHLQSMHGFSIEKSVDQVLGLVKLEILNLFKKPPEKK